MKSIEERVAEIKDKHTRGYNCAQIVLCSYAEELGIDEETLFRISEGFGAGMGGMMQTCGAVTAMFMALGLANSSGDLQACDTCLLYTSPSPRDGLLSRMPSSA